MSLFLWIDSWSLACSLLLLVFPQCGCCYTSCCPKCFLSSPHFFKFFFSFCYSAWVFFATLSSKSLIRSSASSNLLFFLPVYYLFRHCILYFWLVLFIVSMSFFMLYSTLIVITPNSLSDKLFVYISSSSTKEFSGSFIWGLFLCLPILTVSLYFLPWLLN